MPVHEHAVRDSQNPQPPFHIIVDILGMCPHTKRMVEVHFPSLVPIEDTQHALYKHRLHKGVK